MKTIRMTITGMTCAACATRIEKVLNRTEGVQEATVNLAMAQASLRFDPRVVATQTLVQQIEKLGYGATDQEKRSAPSFAGDADVYRNRLATASIISIPLLWGMLEHVPGLSGIWIPEPFYSPIVQWIIATILQFYIGYPFYYGAYQALKQRSANMDTLVALSTTAAYLYSHYMVFRHRDQILHGSLFFDSIAVIMIAVLLGKWLESLAKGKALKDLNALYGLQPQLVRVERAGGEQWIPAELLGRGELVIIHSGEPISADGIVVDGVADVDESMLTGESETVVKSAGAPVYSGTRAVNGTLRIEATTDVRGTRLSRIIGLVEEAQSVKPDIARKVDQAAAWFVPAMLGAALLTFSVWFAIADVGSAIRYAMAVLLAACPCALGLATPVSIVTATSLAAKSGILFKQGRVLEQLHRVDSVLLDKTGTLTEGKPHVRLVHTMSGWSQASLLRVAAAVGQYSKHPAPQAVFQTARSRGLSIPGGADVTETPGYGMEGTVEGKKVLLGSRNWLLLCKTDLEGTANPETGPGAETWLYVAVDGRMAGVVSLTDRIKDDAAATVRSLKKQAEVRMVTGDRERSALAVAKQVGIGKVHAGMLPEHKLELVRSLQKKGRKVAVIGDGMNDAAALGAADVGIAMGSGTDTAVHAGDVVLLNNQLSSIADSIAISRAAIGNIRQNLLFAVLYNLWTVPLAAVGYLDPKAACMLMAFSSLLVVGNALRLQRFKARGTL